MKRNHGLDFLKAVCAFLIVCIHVQFPGVVGKVFTPLTRIAVPVFFMITGYYYSDTVQRKKEQNQLLKIFWLFLGANLLYLAWNLLKTALSGGSVIQIASKMFRLGSVLKFVIFNESPFGTHLWYIGAILYVLLIVFVFERRWDRKKLYPLIPVLLLADLVFGKYSLLLLGREFPYIFVRNFLCVGLPYFLIGDMLYVNHVRISSKKAISGILVFMIMTLVERFLLGAFQVNAQRDHYISTTFLAVSVFLLAVQHEKAFNNKGNQALCSVGARLSSNIYVLHPIVISISASVVAHVSCRIPIDRIYSYLAPFVVFLLTTIMSWGLHKILIKTNPFMR